MEAADAIFAVIEYLYGLRRLAFTVPEADRRVEATLGSN